VFVVGGGGYVEYTNLLEWSERASAAAAGVAAGAGGAGAGGAGAGGVGGKRITYGSTEILTPQEFLKTLGSLAQV